MGTMKAVTATTTNAITPKIVDSRMMLPTVPLVMADRTASGIVARRKGKTHICRRLT
jgi:hypothetical protein